MKKILLNYLLPILIFSFQSKAQVTVGLIQNSPQSFNGYTLFSSFNGDSVYLVDNCGKLAHKWACSQRSLRNPNYLLPNGNLLYAGKISTDFASGAGMFEQLDWNGNVVWNYAISDTMQCAHHGFRPMPNGNVLAVVWERKSVADQIAAGRMPSAIGGELWSEKIVEIQPNGPNTKVVWEWKLWDHLVQKADPTMANFGDVKSHPELIDVNLLPGSSGSWVHINSVDYNPALDQILFCSRNFSEVFIIDHSTTTIEAASHSGGISGKGGDILYRWGNAANYERGTAAEKKLFRPHDGHWIKDGLPDSGKVLIFNNGESRVGTKYSTVEMITPPVLPNSNYAILPDSAFTPHLPGWTYPTIPDSTFYSSTQGSAQKLPNGNVLIAESNSGEFREVDTKGTIVWQYTSPVNPAGIIIQGGTIGDNSVFMIHRYAADDSALVGKVLTPGAPIEINPLPYNCSIYKVDVADVNRQPHSLKLFPNPATASVTLQFSASSNKKVLIRITDLSGRTVYENAFNSVKGENTYHLPVNNLSAGMYLLQLRQDEMRLEEKLFVK